MALAERHGLTLVSADSRQIYRRFDIGTAKPSAADRARVPHAGIDVADPTERWSAMRWAADAERAIRQVGVEKALVVGGTGFYLRALVAPFHEAPALDVDRRAVLEVELSVLSLAELRQRCLARDPARAHLGRAQLLRAIEVAELTDRSLSDWHAEPLRPPPFTARWLVVDPGHALAGHIAGRLDSMLDAGWLGETRLLEQEVPADAPAWQGCGYRALREHVLGTRTLESARQTILIETRQYAKRQRTWFRHQIEKNGGAVVQVDPHDPHCAARVDSWWHEGAPA